MSTQPYIGTIKLFAGDFAPRGYALCNGQLLSIAQNQALFSILGTKYGGDGQVTFALPDLRGRVPIHWGSGQGLQPIEIGQRAGEETHTLIASELAFHTHSVSGTVSAQSANGTSTSPANNVPAASRSRDNQYAATSDTTMSGGAIALAINPAGSGQAHNNMQPYLAVTFIIATEGLFPSRNNN